MTGQPADGRTRVLLVRHGETDWNRKRRIQGWAPSSLNDRGREQARAVGEHITAAYDVDRVVASDLRRTRETTAQVREAGVDAEPTFLRAWRERDFGVYQGLGYDKLFERHPEFAAESGVVALRAQPAGGERLPEAYERVVDGWTHLCAEAVGETVLVVTHGGPIYFVLGHVKGQDVLTAVQEHSLDNCGVTELLVGEETELVRENETV
ncbi:MULTISPECIES: histidine phosphatase family protein [Salinibaculum]|uniref:histidine phosphatase family protein n=1 Tax=Salinibaculum TaxID=2732368 RepID=UPI0030D20C01